MATDDRYEVLEVLGRGGMGSVYRAVHRDLGRTVALKRLTAPGGEPSGEYLQRFRVDVVYSLAGCQQQGRAQRLERLREHYVRMRARIALDDTPPSANERGLETDLGLAPGGK